MDNMKKILNSHNKSILNATNEENDRKCNCRDKNKCPLDNKCLSSNIVYKAEVTTNNTDNSKKSYIGISETEFKSRFRNHQKSFNHRKYSKDTELSKYIWDLKDNNIDFNIQWSIIKNTSSYTPSTKSCNLCLSEKLLICTFKDKNNLINKRLDLVSKCRHETKYIIKNYKEK